MATDSMCSKSQSRQELSCVEVFTKVCFWKRSNRQLKTPHIDILMFAQILSEFLLLFFKDLPFWKNENSTTMIFLAVHVIFHFPEKFTAMWYRWVPNISSTDILLPYKLIITFNFKMSTWTKVYLLIELSSYIKAFRHPL